MKSPIHHIENDDFIIFRSSYSKFCEGNNCAALIISILEFNYVGLIQRNKPPHIQLSHSKIRTIINEEYQRPAIADALKWLENKRVITKIQNANHRKNEATTWLFNPEPINEFLVTYHNFRCKKFDNEPHGRCKKFDTYKNISKEDNKEGKDSSLLSSTTVVVRSIKILRRKKPTTVSFAKPISTIFSNNHEAEVLCNYWKSFRPISANFALLTTKLTGALEDAISAINKALKYDTVETIKQAMSTYSAIIAAPNTIIHPTAPGHRVKLYDFFGLKGHAKGMLKDNLANHPNSPMNAFCKEKQAATWYNECKKGLNYLQTTYAAPIKYKVDQNPLMTANIEAAYEKRIDKIPNNPQTKNKFIRASIRLLEFLETYKKQMRWMSNRDEYDHKHKFGYNLIDALIHDCPDKSIINVGWIDSDKTFNERLPKYLIDIAYMHPIEKEVKTTVVYMKPERVSAEMQKRMDKQAEFQRQLMLEDDDDEPEGPEDYGEE